MRNPHEVIIKPIVTERSMEQLEEKKYTFEVSRDANKIEIKHALEVIFGVNVEKVSTINVKGKMKRMGKHEGRRPDWKKAVVKLKENSKTIEFFEGMA